MSTLKEIKEQALEYKDWVKFGSKLNDPFLSIFSPVIIEGISSIKYEVDKNYYFDDGEFNFKINVVNDEGSPRFNFFIKPKSLESIKEAEETKLYFGMTPGIFLSVVVFGILIILLGLLSGPLLKAFFGV
jgi:hypothetical protein